YRLEIGKPGSSFAFEVASKIGLPQPIIERARKKVGAKQKNVDDLRVSLEKERLEAQEQQEKALATEQHYERLRLDYEALKASRHERKQGIIRQAKAEPSHLLKNSNSLVERTVREIKESAREANPSHTSRSELEQSRKKLEESLRETAPEENKEKP